ncbi:MAG: response regulator [Treponema sp.]|nr:response regulator [Candidatus Treponema equifaecale]
MASRNSKSADETGIKMNAIDATRYLASTLHEIRTPIQTIIGATELMQETMLDKEQSEYIRQIQFSAEGLLNLANNILDLAKIQSNEFTLETIPFDIIYMTEHIVDSVSVKAFNKGVEIVTNIRPGVPSMINGDSMRVRQIMLNIVSNAVKFTNSGYVLVELSYEKEKGVIFQVTDTGIGISEDMRSKIFTDYFQGDLSTYRRFGGTGLGLSICKNLVNLMKGEIGVSENPEGGSVFWVNLPLVPAIDPMVYSFTKNPAEYRVLIVDDSRLAAIGLQNKFHRLGFKNADICTKSTEVLELLKKAHDEGNPYRIAFIDMIMPESDGWHLGFEINALPEIRKNISLYLLVPEGQMGKDAKMTAMGWFDGYLYKPIKRELLLKLLYDYFSEGEKIETLYEPETVGEIKVPETAPVKDDSGVAKGLKILIAEDHPMNRKLMESFLKKFGAEVFLAEDGVKAVEAVRENPEMDIIFMDIYMPEKSGIEATSELRNLGYGGIIVACTANNDSKDFEEYMKIGINDILVKPFKSFMIKNIIEKWKSVMQTSAVRQIARLNPAKEGNQND